MDEKKRKIVIASVLVLAIVFLLGKSLLHPKKSGAKTAADSSSLQSTVVDNLAFLNRARQSEKMRRAQEDVEGAEWGRDPFSSGQGGGVGNPGDLRLSGIVWDEKKPLAIVNEKLLQRGDTIEGYEVVGIKRSSVVLSLGEKKVELELFQNPEGSAPTNKEPKP